MGNLTVVVGAQFGSEGKGAIAGYLSRSEESVAPLMAARVAGPNAGHTVYDENGRAHKLRQVPVAAVTNPKAELVIAAGSEVDLNVLSDEIVALEDAGVRIIERLWVDRSATLIEPRHLQEESNKNLNYRIGSTAKGIGAARSDRIWRIAGLVGDRMVGLKYANTAALMQEHLRDGGRVLVEGTQGYGLGLHTHYYPQVTSSDCRAIDFLAMAGLSPWADYIDGDFEVWLVARTYPIRVAGNSGPLYRETSWAELGLAPETTTVTQRIRRVGLWDQQLVFDAIAANGGPGPNVSLALTMFDYLLPSMAGETKLNDSARTAHARLEDELGVAIELVGTSPTTVVDLRA